jgi:hypothetical protein
MRIPSPLRGRSTLRFSRGGGSRPNLALPRNRVADQERTIELECVDHSQRIIAQAIGLVLLVSGSGFAGGSKTASRDGVDVILLGKYRSFADRSTFGLRKFWSA